MSSRSESVVRGFSSVNLNMFPSCCRLCDHRLSRSEQFSVDTFIQTVVLRVVF
ncbi:hypothetical protein PO124_10845 [Bacillus licheniformis]|nr:hypothetical protein [Bacillus licheniformis]